MNIFYEENLKREAMLVRKALRKSFGIEPEFHAIRAMPLRYNRRTRGYEPSSDKPGVFITGKDLFAVGAKSREDDYIYGWAHNDTYFISVARLRGRSDRPVSRVTVSPRKYRARISAVGLHELGHALVADQHHYHEYVITNPATGHSLNTGPHCPNPRCVMSQAEDLRSLDAMTAHLYKRYFCRKCARHLPGA